jgi:hypothetical protein
MENNKQTAVEWLIEQLEGDDSKIARVIGLKKYNSLIQQAKAMHKEEILIAYDNGWEAGSYNPEQYYNEEYGK